MTEVFFERKIKVPVSPNIETLTFVVVDVSTVGSDKKKEFRWCSRPVRHIQNKTRNIVSPLFAASSGKTGSELPAKMYALPNFNWT